MTTKELYILGIDPGGTTGWAWLMVPRLSIFGDEPGQILEWDYGELTGSEPKQATHLAAMAREIQGLAYKTGPALICEAWDQDPAFKVTDPEVLSPVRLGAQLELLKFQGKLGDSTLHYQSRSQKECKATSDDRMKKCGLYVAGSSHIQDAVKHAVVALRRAAEDPFTFGLKLWPYPPNGVS
jgi:hypothetical protein